MQVRSVELFDDRDDVDLLSRARAGDTQCADVLWVRVRPAVLSVARGITGNKHDAEDLASEAMTKVFTAIADGEGPRESVLPYLYATMRNLHISNLRRQARAGTPVELNEARVLNLVTTEPDVIESELVGQAFRSLPERWRYVLWASLIEGRPGHEIAAEMKIKPAAVHALKSRALEGLRQQYLSEHVKRSEEEECADVHRVLASIARGRTRKSTDLNQVWRHLRSCEHCAEGYNEITAINNRIGALLGPAAVTAASTVPAHSHTAGVLEVLRLPVSAGNLVAAASVAGILAISTAAITFNAVHEPARPSTSQSVPVQAPASPEAADAATGPATNPAARPPASASGTCLAAPASSPELGTVVPDLDAAGIDPLVPDLCEDRAATPPTAPKTDADATIARLREVPDKLTRDLLGNGALKVLPKPAPPVDVPGVDALPGQELLAP